jgi:hypothetical protein
MMLLVTKCPRTWPLSAASANFVAPENPDQMALRAALLTPWTTGLTSATSTRENPAATASCWRLLPVKADRWVKSPN